jgi:hypothetical protein
MQLSLLEGVERAERPWKVVRRVSKQVYAELRRSGGVARSTQRVITALAYYRNRTMTWPTPAELTKFMYDLKRIPKNESRYVAPRLTELIRGAVVRDPTTGARVRRGGGVCDQLPARRCRESGSQAHPVAIREAGSGDRRVA